MSGYGNNDELDPDAPAGGGGPGHFRIHRSPKSLGLAPHSLAKSIRHLKNEDWMDKHIHGELHHLAIEAEANSRLDELMHQRLLTLAAEAAVNQLVDDQIRRKLLEIELTGGLRINSPARSAQPQPAPTPPPSPKSAAPGTEEEELEARFVAAFARATAATEKGDTASAKRYWAEVDQISWKMKVGISKEFAGAFLGAMALSVANYFIDELLVGRLAEGFIEAVPSSETQVVQFERSLFDYMVKKYLVGVTKATMKVAIESLGYVITHRRNGLKEVSSEWVEVLGFVLLAGLAERFECEGLKFLVERIEQTLSILEGLKGD
jgi:hypothetical protein